MLLFNRRRHGRSVLDLVTLPRREGDVEQHELDTHGAAAWLAVMFLGEHSSWTFALRDPTRSHPTSLHDVYGHSILQVLG
jgi:hypothetical protein